MGQALYRKYRSKKLDEIIGQEQITESLGNALKQGRISHAYLFTGPRGVGKTSIARILAHEINDLPYTDDSADIDIIEIDAASNRRIDEIRELREKVYIAPTSAKYKVYIIDEVHMLTKEAFNALLKTLEEPPAHVVFILATTDAHKLPATIVSRTQRYNFLPVNKAKVASHLKHIADQEHIEVSPEALDLLAEHGEGSFRDSISLMDQASNRSDKLMLEDVQKLLGLPPIEIIEDIIKLLAEGTEVSVLLSKIEELYSNGYQATSIAKEISRSIRYDLVEGKTRIGPDTSMALLSQLIEVPLSHDPERFLEIVLIKNIKVVKPEPIVMNIEAPAEPKVAPSNPEVTNDPVVTENKPIVTKQHKIQNFDASIWPQVLHALKQRHNTLYGVIRMAEPKFSGNTLTLAFEFAFHEKKIMQNSNRQILSEIIHEITGQNINVECILDKAAVPAKVNVETTPVKPDTSLKAISNIFGGSELIES